jgi:hypothetical protein
MSDRVRDLAESQPVPIPITLGSIEATGSADERAGHHRLSYGLCEVNEGATMASLEMSWGALLDDIDRIGRELPFAFFAACPVSEAEPCVLVDDDEFKPDEDVPGVARRRGFTACLLVDDLQQVIENLRQQDPVAGRDLLLRAITHYFDRDAFIDLTN